MRAARISSITTHAHPLAVQGATLPGIPRSWIARVREEEYTPGVVVKPGETLYDKARQRYAQ